MNINEDGIKQFKKEDPEIPSSFREATKSFIPKYYVNKLTIFFVLITIFLFTITNIIFHFYFSDIKVEMGEEATVYLNNNSALEFVYINDIHLDPLYVASSSASTFCRKFDERFADRPYYFGQYKCDLPISTLKSMLRYINSKIYSKSKPKPNFVVLGGDTVAHYLPFSIDESHSYIKKVVRNISKSFNKKLFDVPLLFVLGNNDYVPNYGGINFTFDKKNFDSLYKNVIGPFIIKDKDYAENYEYDPNDRKQIEHDLYVKEQKRTFKRGGYYYYDISEAKLRILVMNTVTYSYWRDIEGYNKNLEIDFLKKLSKTRNSRQNHFIESEDESKSDSEAISEPENDDESDANYIDPNDPYGQFEWILESSRDAFENHNYTVAIALHIPPGSFYTDGNYSRISQGWKTSFIQRFDAVIAEANIEFIISAHSHLDLFLPINGENSVSKQYSIGAPALSPNHWNNPGFRIYKLSPKGKLFDYEQYYADISSNPQPKFKLNQKSKSTGLKWKLDYSFKDSYSSKIYEEENDNDDNDDFDDISDFEQYNSTSNAKVEETQKILPEMPKEFTGIDKNTIAQLIKWTSSNPEGRWLFKKRFMANGEEHGPFYKCLQTCTTVEQIYKCIGSLAPKIVPKQ